MEHGQCDTILLHSGQEVRDELDLYIPGIEPSLDLVIQRRHTSRRVASNDGLLSGAIPFEDSTFGASWSFNYQRRLVKHTRPDNTLVLREFAFDRFDEFELVPGLTDRWEGTDGRIDRVIWNVNSATVPVLVRADGMRLVYSPFNGNSARLETIIAPSGNGISFAYAIPLHDPSHFKTFQIDRITDSYGQEIHFHYASSGAVQPVTAITDFDGRVVTYGYDSTNEHLISCTDPLGNTTAYEYAHANSSVPELKHNLTAIVFPNQATASGSVAARARLAWEYFTSDDLSTPSDQWRLGWVKSHTVGNQTILPEDLRAGGTFHYAYTLPSTLVPQAGPDDVAIVVDVTNRRGHATRLEFNTLGQMVREQVLSDLRHPASPVTKTRTFGYTEDGLLAWATGAMGDRVDIQYATGTSALRGRQVEQTYTPDPARASATAQAWVKARVEYEPIFNRPHKIIDPRGLQPGADANAHTTTFTYDWMEDVAAAVQALDAAKMLPADAQTIQALLANQGIASVGDVNGDGSTAQYFGNVVKVTHPPVALPPQASIVGLGATQQAHELFRYNSRGQLIWHRDAEENVHLRTYYPAVQDPVSLDIIVNGLGLGSLPYDPTWQGGYLRSIVADVADATSTQAQNTGFNQAVVSSGAPAPAAAETLFVYTANQGPQPAGASYTRSVPTLVVDPRGVVTRFDINGLDEVVKITRAAASSNPGLTPTPYVTLIDRDPNRNVIRIQVEEADNLQGVTGFTTFEWAYNILDLEYQSREDSVGAGAIDATVLSYYDESTNLIRLTRRHDIAAQSSTTVWTYDERDILMSRTDGFGTIHAATFTNDVDLNGNVIAMTDADPGPDQQPDTATIQYDGFNRVVTYIERDGTVTDFQRDSIGNVLRRQIHGKIERHTSATGTYVSVDWERLSDTFFKFDTRNRLFQVDEELFHYPTYGNGEIPDSGALNTQGGATGTEDGKVSNVLVRDRLGRVVVHVDADADAFIYRYDGRGNVVQLEDGLQNKSVYEYDPSGNLTKVTELERSNIMGGTVEAFVHQATYDALNRLITWVEPNGAQTTQYQYDSRDNLKRRIDAMGNHVEYRYDRLNRLLEVSQYLSLLGTNASAQNLDNTQGGADGVITTRSAWDDLHRLVSQTDDRGNVTHYTYDVLDRRTQIGFADGTVERAVFNPDGELVVSIDPSGILDRAGIYDQVGRRLQETVGLASANSGVDIVGSTVRRWRYDGLGRVWSYTDNNDAYGQTYNDTLVEFRYDSLGRRIFEQQTIGGSTLPPTRVNYQGHSRVKSEVYPGGRRIERAYDALDRLTQVTDVPTQGAPTLLAARDFAGRGRLLRQSFANGTQLDKRNTAGTASISGPGAGFDTNGRTVRHEWKFGAQVVAGYVSTYNQVNRRTSETRTHFNGHTDTYQFDSAYRIIGFVRGGATSVTSSCSLDGVDKMFAFNDEGVQRVPEIDQHVQAQENGLNQYSSVNNIARRYDKNGGLNTLYPLEPPAPGVPAGPTVECRYDHLKRLTRVGTVSGGTFTPTHEYVYDADGRRLAKLNGANQAVIKRYVYDCGWRVIEERDAAGNIQHEFVEGEGIDEHLVMVRASGPMAGTYFYHTNAQGFVGALTNASGAVVERYEYKWHGTPIAVDAAGVPVPAGDTNSQFDEYGRSKELGNPYLFQGRELDPETGYYQFRHRYYDPRIGEFTSIDPSGLWRHGQGNGYSAFGADCWNHVDPLGEFFFLAPIASFVGRQIFGAAVEEVVFAVIEWVFGEEAAEFAEDLSGYWDVTNLAKRMWRNSVRGGMGALGGRHTGSTAHITPESSPGARAPKGPEKAPETTPDKPGAQVQPAGPAAGSPPASTPPSTPPPPGGPAKKVVDDVIADGDCAARGGAGGGGEFARGGPPREPGTGNYRPDPDATGPHTTLGTRTSHDGRGPYTQGATFDKDGTFVGRTDVTDHGRRDHPNPHFHPATGPASVKRGAHPLPEAGDPRFRPK